MNINFEKLKNELTNEEFLKEIPKMEEEFSKHKIVDLKEKDVVLIENFSKKVKVYGRERLHTYFIFKTKKDKYILLFSDGKEHPIYLSILNQNPVNLLKNKNDFTKKDLKECISYFYTNDENWFKSEYKDEIYTCLLEYKNYFLYEENDTNLTLFHKFFIVYKMFVKLYDEEFSNMIDEYRVSYGLIF